MRLRQLAVAAALLPLRALPDHAEARDPSRDTLPADDGWASYGSGTTGGSAADPAHVLTVTTRAPGNGSDTPKIIKVAGTIDANTDDRGRRLDCADYATDGYDLTAYLAAYAPRTRGAAKPAGPQEDGRQASAAERVVLDLRDAYDCFPVRQPSPKFSASLEQGSTPSGGLGDWKTAYDNLWLSGASHVWVDHVTFGGRGHSDADWSRFADHDKAMLIGSGDTATGDRGKLRVTLHHNEFRGVVQRAPRVRFGQVHLYNNRYLVTGDDYRYSIGVSTESAIHAEDNAFHTPGHVEAADLVKSWNGTALHQSGTLFNGYPVDLLTIHNAYSSGSERDLTADAGWTPTLHTTIDSADAADRAVARGAGAGRHP
ncbi:pectate lyase [Streptomyces acidiscabies]|uniref:pectate lyase family protein n=1 Tax=Streptomyces acidiscabies TaxID=42234 RepID=UPI0038F74BD8